MIALGMTGELARAIQERRTVRFRYRRPGWRVCMPQVLYVSPGGRMVLDAVQVSGPSSSGPLPGWRQFEADAIADLELLPVTFDDCDPELNLDNRRYARVLAACAD